MKKSIFTAVLALLVMGTANAQEITAQTVFEPTEADLQRLAAIRPEMKYKEIKKIYKDCKYRDFTFVEAKEYSVARGLASLGLPGMGQLILGEPGIAAAWLVPGILCDVTLIAGTSLMLGGAMAAAMYGTFEIAFLPLLIFGSNKENDFSELDAEIAKAQRLMQLGEILLIAGACGFVTINISSMIHAMHIAKVKNMYYDDLRKLDAAPKFDLKLSPYMDILAAHGSNAMPVAGLSLKLTF